MQIIHQEQLVAEETTLNTIEIPLSRTTSTSSDRLDELANMLDSCIEQLSPLAAQTESIEKETERMAMLTRRMMEPPMMESEGASAKRRRRTRYTLLLGIMENAVYLAPNSVAPFATRLTSWARWCGRCTRWQLERGLGIPWPFVGCRQIQVLRCRQLVALRAHMYAALYIYLSFVTFFSSFVYVLAMYMAIQTVLFL